jgi:transposase
MGKRQYKHGIERAQGFLLPVSMDEYVTADNPVRAIDVYVATLDLPALGFENTQDQHTAGQPAFPPAALLKLYLYGYLHRVRSSRRLEAETQRNLEVIWLVEGLHPGYKTIADFRQHNRKALTAVNKDFVQVCKDLDLFGRELVAIDGSFFRGNVSKGSIYTEDRLTKSLERIEGHITDYLKALDAADQTEAGATAEVPALQEKLASLRARHEKQQARLTQLQASGATQLAEVDPDARLLTKSGQCVAGYNVQTAVDAKHKLLVLAEATQASNDEGQLTPIAQAAQAALEVDALTVTADKGYFQAQGIKACVDAQITPYVPEPDRTAPARAQGRFEREAFTYDPGDNSYRCPAGQTLGYSHTQQNRGRTIFHYGSSAPTCAACPLRAQCLPPKSPTRIVTRWEHETVLEAHRARMAQAGRAMMATRAALVEHPFGTLKLWCGWRHFLVRGLAKVQGELSLLMLCYNFKRVLTILGLDAWRAYCLQRA